MTKKFWKDWQRRFGETQQVYLSNYCLGELRNSLWYCKDLLNLHTGERILSVKFNKDTVDLVIERKDRVFDREKWGFHYVLKNEYLTLNRKDIISVDFKIYY